MADLPLPAPTVPLKPLTTFKLLSFDIYGTLIDWESSIIQSISPLLSHISPSSPHANKYSASGPGRIALAALFNSHEHDLQASNPTLRYDKLLTEAYLRLAQEFDVEITDAVRSDAEKFGLSVDQFQAFPDTVDAMKRLAKHYKLVPLSNVDKASFTRTCSGPLNGVPFWRVYVAEEIGSYKPSLNNFNYLIEHVKSDSQSEGNKGIEKEDILHVAQSLQHDHVPAKKMGMSSVWVNRSGAGMGGRAEEWHQRGEVGYGWRVGSLGELADLVEEEFKKEGK
jgi:2-haloalkanoic acid dehalogenase type II